MSVAEQEHPRLVDARRQLAAAGRAALAVLVIEPRADRDIVDAQQSGEWRVIEDSPLVERTMERIAGSLRQQAGAA